TNSATAYPATTRQAAMPHAIAAISAGPDVGEDASVKAAVWPSSQGRAILNALRTRARASGGAEPVAVRTRSRSSRLPGVAPRGAASQTASHPVTGATSSANETAFHAAGESRTDHAANIRPSGTSAAAYPMMINQSTHQAAIRRTASRSIGDPLRWGWGTSRGEDSGPGGRARTRGPG